MPWNYVPAAVSAAFSRDRCEVCSSFEKQWKSSPLQNCTGIIVKGQGCHNTYDFDSLTWFSGFFAGILLRSLKTLRRALPTGCAVQILQGRQGMMSFNKEGCGRLLPVAQAERSSWSIVGHLAPWPHHRWRLQVLSIPTPLDPQPVMFYGGFWPSYWVSWVYQVYFLLAVALLYSS